MTEIESRISIIENQIKLQVDRLDLLEAKSTTPAKTAWYTGAYNCYDTKCCPRQHSRMRGDSWCGECGECCPRAEYQCFKVAPNWTKCGCICGSILAVPLCLWDAVYQPVSYVLHCG